MKKVFWLAAVSVVGAASACAVDGGSADQIEVSESSLTGSGGGTQAGESTVWHSNWSGRNADTWIQDWATGTMGMLSAGENGTGANRKVSVWVDIQMPDPDAQFCPYPWDPTWCFYGGYIRVSGYAELPSSAFTIATHGSAAKAELHASIPVQRCTGDYYWGICEPGTLAADVIWRADGRFTSSHHGVSSFSDGFRTFRSRGSYSSASAAVEGTIGTVTLTNGSGNISDSKGTSVTREIIDSTP